EARKIPSLARVCSSLLPAGPVMVLLWLITISTLPELTSRARALKMITTSARTTTVNIATPRKIATFKASDTPLHRLQVDTAEGHEAKGHQANGDKGDTEPLKAGGDIAVLELFADTGQGDDGQRPAGAGAKAVDRALADVVIPLHHEQRG